VAGVILDLRRNGGGSLEEAINLTGLFIKEGPVVQVRQPDGRVFTDTDPDTSVFYDGPLVVLTSRFSASASEIFAAAMQDYGRGIVIGQETYGKGSVQSMLDLSDGSGLKLTIARYLTPSGATIDGVGIEPQEVIAEVAGEDRALVAARKWLER